MGQKQKNELNGQTQNKAQSRHDGQVNDFFGFGMNQKGNVIIFILIGFLVLALIPVLITSLFEPAKLIMQVVMIFDIYTTVRGYMGPGNLTIMISGILIYFMVFKWFEIFLSLYILQVLLGLGFMSVVVWGVGRTMGG